MSIKKITDKVFCITTRLQKPNLRFEGIWAVPTGVTINSYVIRGEKNALIDATIGDDDAGAAYLNDLASIGLKLSDIDVLVLNHLEPDHSGFIQRIKAENPAIQIYTTAKGVAFVKNFFKIAENLHAVADNETVSLGTSGTLQFFETPNIHWPETMMTYYTQEKILFPCDCFGGYGDVSSKILDSENSEAELEAYKAEVIRYYANIMASFNSFVIKAIDKIPADTKVICPSHGIIWCEKKPQIIELYKKLAGYGSTFAEAAWAYGVDPRLSPAISAVESTKGRYNFLPYNAWGWGSVSWSSWEEAIWDHTAGLAAGYGGRLSVAGAARYNPANPSGWYSAVLTQMEYI